MNPRDYVIKFGPYTGMTLGDAWDIGLEAKAYLRSVAMKREHAANPGGLVLAILALRKELGETD